MQFSMSAQFNCQKHFYFKLFNLVKQFYFKQFSLVYVHILVLFDPIRCGNTLVGSYTSAEV